MKTPESKIELATRKPSKEHSYNQRPALEGVYYNAEKKELAAADGYILAVLPAEMDDSIEATEPSHIIPAEVFAAAHKSKFNGVSPAPVILNGKARTITKEGAWLEKDYIDATFPDYNRLLEANTPEPGTKPTISIDVKKLLQLAQAMGREDYEKNLVLHLWITGPESPVYVESDIPGAKGAIMPVHTKKYEESN